jgi:diaminohydroxyphosphoribosylaminopyrimidine deaminase/5-amino-6-(5-phosphoribosylamino)uracil reductase
MQRAIDLARSRGRYVSPNPRVGAVLVKGDRIVGEGAHERYGGPHAEVLALRRAGARAKGATLYVTLEPCSHYGKTPPCAYALINAGVKKVVAAMKDPFPLVSGGGFKALRKSGIQVRSGVLESEARRLNEYFISAIARQRPEVLLKTAMTLDGKIAMPKGPSRWITGARARRRAHELRSQVDAILVGSRTALLDDPSLTVRLPGFVRKDGWPLRVLLDSRLRVPLSAKLFDRKATTLVFTAPGASRAKEKALQKRGVRVFRVTLREKMLSLKAVLDILRALQVRRLMVEGGGAVTASFLKEGLADSLALFIAPRVLGDKALPWVGGVGISALGRTFGLGNARIEKIGRDFLITGRMGK